MVQSSVENILKVREGRSMKKLQFSLLSLSLLVLSLGAFAQIQNGQFTGTVTDPSGAAIANAKVTVTNVGTNLSVTTTTGPTGLYKFNELPAGTYQITAEAQGFKTITNRGLVLNAGTIQRADFSMQLGQTREVIEVTGEAAAVNTEDSKLASTVAISQVANLPLNGRNVYDLIQLAPGAVNVRGVMQEVGANTVVNGLREDFNGFLINGSSNKGLSGGAVNQPIEDTVQEFQELTLNMSAQYGNSAGSVTNLITKSGTNQYHGSGWYFGRNDYFDANNFFANQTGTPRQALRFNQFGGTFGGALIKDKLFFFLSYQDTRFTESATADHGHGRDSGISAGRDQLVCPTPPRPCCTRTSRPPSPGHDAIDLETYFGATHAAAEGALAGYLCPGNSNALIAGRIAAIIGVTAEDQAAMATIAGCGAIPGLQAGTFARTGVPFQLSTIAISGSQNQNNSGAGNLYNGREASGRLDYNISAKDRMFAQFAWNRLPDSFGFPNTEQQQWPGRGFPQSSSDPESQRPDQPDSYLQPVGAERIPGRVRGKPESRRQHCAAWSAPISVSTTDPWASVPTRDTRKPSTRTFTAIPTWFRSRTAITT